ncbi:S-layer homology domain-containing protein, partial [Peptoniphilus sp. HMSC062D09]|uniref:S-layer homology domain-containing protein n=1 Tax=Peptoniphilus sp. HMSC062D09 TaxID=1739305 RepID=UPI000AA4A040
ITKSVDKTTYEKAGDVLTYKVTVTNTGEKKLENLVLTDSLVTITDNTFTLNVNESKEFIYTYKVTEADVIAKKVTNTATVTLDKDSKTASTTSTLKEDKPKPPVTNIITEYVDIYGNELIPSKDGDQPVEVIPGYEFIETRRTEKVVSHIYKKIEREDPNPWFPLFPRVERKEKVETISVNAVVPEKTLLNKEDHKAYMFGYPDWTFLPNNNMTRAEVTAMFARLLKNYPSTNVKYNLPYSDVFEGDWYYPAVGFMTENNIIKGYEDGTFRPNAPITRAEFATIASKFDEILGGDVKGFYDVPASHWALKYINSAYERGWVTGYEDGSFRPDRFITRAEVVTVTNKMLIRYADVDYVRAHRDLLINFKDLDESHWAYFNIMEATHGHDFMRKANGKDETWERLNGEAFIFPDLRYEER